MKRHMLCQLDYLQGVDHTKQPTHDVSVGGVSRYQHQKTENPSQTKRDGQ